MSTTASSTPSAPSNVFQQRLACLRSACTAAGYSGYVATSEESLYYLLGLPYKPLERPFFALVPAACGSCCDPFLVVPLLELAHLRSNPAGLDDAVAYDEFPAPAGRGYADVVAGALAQRKVPLHHRPLAIDPATPVHVFHALKDALAPARLVTSPLLEDLRAVKDARELEQIRTACRHGVAGMRDVLARVYSGISELEILSVSSAVQGRIIAEGPVDLLTTSLLTMSWVAPLSADPHSVPLVSDRLRAGPHIAMVFYRVNGYACECERTFFVEEPTAEAKQLFGLMLQARDLAFSMVRPGAVCEEIDRAVRKMLGDAGHAGHILHRTGHGIGISNHEGPYLALGCPDVLRAGMVISVEPGIYIEKLGGFRHSDTVLVTENGFEVLTGGIPVSLQDLTITDTKP
eukprot:m51a1_g14104 hypothetical protein (404) ;mRNA; r:99626-101233